LIFCLYMEKLESLFFCGLSRRPDHLFVPALFALLAGQNIFFCDVFV